MESFRFTHKRAPSTDERQPHREMEDSVKMLDLKEAYAKEQLAALVAQRSEKRTEM